MKDNKTGLKSKYVIYIRIRGTDHERRVWIYVLVRWTQSHRPVVRRSLASYRSYCCEIMGRYGYTRILGSGLLMFPPLWRFLPRHPPVTLIRVHITKVCQTIHNPECYTLSNLQSEIFFYYLVKNKKLELIHTIMAWCLLECLSLRPKLLRGSLQHTTPFKHFHLVFKGMFKKSKSIWACSAHANYCFVKSTPFFKVPFVKI